jgi:hypothetical protein
VKKLILLTIAVAALALTSLVSAQTADVNFDKNETYKAYTLIDDGDTISGTSTVSKTFYTNKTGVYGYIYEFNADSVKADSTVNVYLEGSINKIKFWPIDTVVWNMTTSDTTIKWESIVLPVGWRYLRSTMEGSGDSTKAKLGPQYLKLLD